MATIIVSQLQVANWYDMIGESTVADATSDRLIHTAHEIELRGESMRKKQKYYHSYVVIATSSRGVSLSRIITLKVLSLLVGGDDLRPTIGCYGLL